MVHFVNLGAYAVVRFELTSLGPSGPYCLRVEHPARTIVEYFDDPLAALWREAEIEGVLTGNAVSRPSMAPTFSH